MVRRREEEWKQHGLLVVRGRESLLLPAATCCLPLLMRQLRNEVTRGWLSAL
jgi:hypothetical protein